METKVLSHFDELPLLSAIAHSAKHQYARYDNTRRYYHTYQHAIQVASAAIDLGADYATSLAAIYHDVVYFAGAGDDYNEVISGKALDLVAKDKSHIVHGVKDYEEAAVSRAQRLIERTSLNWHLKQETDDYQLSILLDADLSPLADDYNSFVINQKRIILENEGHPESKGSQRMSADFLMKLLLSRGKLFRTQLAQQKFEELAKKNIHQWQKHAHRPILCGSD